MNTTTIVKQLSISKLVVFTAKKAVPNEQVHSHSGKDTTQKQEAMPPKEKKKELKDMK